MASDGDAVGVPVAIALGSNLGDRDSNLRHALTALGHRLDRLAVSSFYDTEPVGVGDQPRFLNAVATGRSTLAADALLDELLAIEARLGRTRPFPGAPRTVDLDLILYGNAVITTPRLTVPHPRFRERAFVLQPLAEIAGDWLDPMTGRSISDLLEQLARSGHNAVSERGEGGTS
jgi:2-amino-4-hydroxy-6-hydroxymethyldihydropteridine diphosphokinase